MRRIGKGQDRQTRLPPMPQSGGKAQQGRPKEETATAHGIVENEQKGLEIVYGSVF